jgi:putrescine transport system substrate-binding protein
VKKRWHRDTSVAIGKFLPFGAIHFLEMMVMKLFSGKYLLCAATTALAFSATGALAQSKELNIYNWSDYIGDKTLENFTKETGIKVRYDNFDTNEILHAKLVAGKTGYDIVVPSSNWAKIQIEGGLLQKLDKSKLSNWKNLDGWWLNNVGVMDPGNNHLVPWSGGVTTLGINVDKLKAALGSMPMPDNAWDLLFKPEYAMAAKKCGVSMLDSADEVFPAALRYLGKQPYSTNKADYDEAAKLLKSVRKGVTLFSSSGYINDMANGSICLALGWNGDMAIAAGRAKEAKKPVNLEVLIPKTGAVLFFDTMAIPKDAKNVENAHLFINYMMRPEVQAEMFNTIAYRGPVRAADKLIEPARTANKSVYMTPETEKLMVPPDMVGNDIRRLRTRLFTSFKTGL